MKLSVAAGPAQDELMRQLEVGWHVTEVRRNAFGVHYSTTRFSLTYPPIIISVFKIVAKMRSVNYIWCAIAEQNIVLRVDISACEHVYDHWQRKAIVDASKKQLPLLRAELWKVRKWLDEK